MGQSRGPWAVRAQTSRRRPRHEVNHSSFCKIQEAGPITLFVYQTYAALEILPSALSCPAYVSGALAYLTRLMGHDGDWRGPDWRRKKTF